MQHDRVIKSLPAVKAKANKEAMLFKCIKGMADKGNINVVCMQGDLVELISSDEGEILVEGTEGWCRGFEICFTPREFVDHFASF
jgi:hypothetical protein